MTLAPHVNPLDLTDAEFLTRAREICATKAAYTTRAEAVTFARRRNYALNAYLCPWCDHWHHTSYDRARTKAFKRRLSRLLRVTPDDNDSPSP